MILESLMRIAACAIVIKADSLGKDNGCHSDTNAIGLMPGPDSLHVLEHASFCKVMLCASVLECGSSESGTMFPFVGCVCGHRLAAHGVDRHDPQRSFYGSNQ